MADIIQTSLKVKGAVTVTVGTLGENVSLVYQPGGNQFLVIHNITASAITPVIKGLSAPSGFKVAGFGLLNLTGGYSMGEIAAGASIALPLHTVREWLKGDVVIEGATGANAYITTTTDVPQYEPLWIQGGRIVNGGVLTNDSTVWG